MQWHSADIGEVRATLKTSTAGLDEKQAQERQTRLGYNELKGEKKPGLMRKLAAQLSDFMVIVLIAAAAISFLSSILSGESDYVDPLIILLIVVLNATMGVMQESKAEKAIDALQKLTPRLTKALRGGSISTIPARELVPGDVVELVSGDYVPADCRIIECNSLSAEESALTGESVPVEKQADKRVSGEAPLSERKNMLYCGTMVVSGKCRAIVVETGMRTEVGRIAGLLSRHANPQTPLQARLESTGKFLGIGALAICAVIFLMGLFQRVPPLDMLLVAISLAVAAIPEGLPAIVTIVLAMGVQRMARSNAIIRKLPAVETLGSATVICSDKTGTLTLSRMTVVSLSGSGLQPADNAFRQKLLTYAVLCSNVSAEEDTGNPTELAVVRAARSGGLNIARLESDYRKTAEFPFDSTRKLMSTVRRSPDGLQLAIAKGAPEVLLSRCINYYENGEKPLSSSVRSEILRRCENMMSGQALRVIAVAYKSCTKGECQNADSAENGLTFLGLIGMEDPPRAEAAEAVATCRRASIKAVMITGDHSATAVAIARRIGIFREGDAVLTGGEIDSYSDVKLAHAVRSCTVFARGTPEHKVRIIKAYQHNGEVVAMTGDGVNDAPALKAADIGCAMGISGTDVAKGAADMILADDNFSSIVTAVKEGRGIYQNIRKSVHFLLSSNTGEILTLFVAFLLGLPMVLLPIQLLFVNLITDSLPALALGVDTIDKSNMEKPPIPPAAGLFANFLWLRILLEGIMIGGLTLAAFGIGLAGPDSGASDPVTARTMAFSVLCLSQLVHAFNTRSSRSLIKIGLLSNRYLAASFVLCAGMLAAVISLPALAAVFKVVPLESSEWLTVCALSLVPLFAVELCKLARAAFRRFAVRQF